jgi:SAM-dependent methyltransferase
MVDPTNTGPAQLDFPPLEMRELVGPTDVAAFDNPAGAFVYPYLAPSLYEAVFDFGCGCGRVARQLIQQRQRPGRYLGIDLHRGMIRWCQTHLQTVVPSFQFVHHDVRNVMFNPGADKPSVAAFPAGDSEFTLVNALSVFTHLTEEQAGHYLRECARVLRTDGVLHSSWFLFDKTDFPMMQEFTNALYISHIDPSAAVIFDTAWLIRTARSVGLTIFQVIPPTIHGFQWMVLMTPIKETVPEASFPPDLAPKGVARGPVGPDDPSKIGL